MTRERDFSEAVKKEAKERAHFSCVMCHRAGFLHIHHIDAHKDGGSDNIENAAPLCPDCHTMYGDNPVMRKQIREMRDFWWSHCTKVAANPSMTATYQRLDGISGQITENTQMLKEVKEVVAKALWEQAAQVSSATSTQEVMLASGFSVPPNISAGRYDTVSVPMPFIVCRGCGKEYDSKQAQCPHCGTSH